MLYYYFYYLILLFIICVAKHRLFRTSQSGMLATFTPSSLPHVTETHHTLQQEDDPSWRLFRWSPLPLLPPRRWRWPGGPGPRWPAWDCSVVTWRNLHSLLVTAVSSRVNRSSFVNLYGLDHTFALFYCVEKVFSFSLVCFLFFFFFLRLFHVAETCTDYFWDRSAQFDMLPHWDFRCAIRAWNR